MNRILSALSGLLVLLFSGQAMAAIPPTTQGEFDVLVGELGVATTYRAVAPADPLGVIGFDIGAEATMTTIDGSTVIVPKVKFQKGLPFGIDVAGYYTKIPLSGYDFTAYGLAISYAILEGGGTTPAVTVRGTYSTMELPTLIGVNTTGLDVAISKGLGPVTPYAGLGLVQISGSDQTINNYTNYSSQENRYFYGANFNLLFMDLAIEADTIGSIQTYSVKAGFRF